jgi:hypothetical protein
VLPEGLSTRKEMHREGALKGKAVGAIPERMGPKEACNPERGGQDMLAMSLALVVGVI